MTDIPQLKENLLRTCKEHVDARINAIQSAMDSVYQSKLTDTKSSAGDKFETGRSMMQMEEEKLKTQMHHAKGDLVMLLALGKRSAVDHIGPGNLVATSQGYYLIAIGVGKVQFDGGTYYCISPGSPIGKELQGKVEGDSIAFNGREIKVLGVY